MPDTVLGFYLLALCVLALAGWWTYRAIVARLRDLHTARHATLLHMQGRRKNGMDRFFSVIGFLFQSQSDLRDLRLLLACVLLKALTVLWLLVFIAMMFTPFFLHLNDGR